MAYSFYGAVYLEATYFVQNQTSIKTKIGRSNLPGFLIPLAKMLQLMGPRQIFIKYEIEGVIFSEGAKLATLTPNFYIGILWHLV